MTVVIIPTYPDPYYDETVSLGDTPYIFRFRYNEREASWRLSLMTSDREPVVEGIKLVAGSDLLGPYRYNTNLPPGILYLTILGSDDSPPALQELGEGLRVELRYVDPA